MRNRTLILATALVMTALGSVANAENKETARREYQEGNRRYDLNEFQPALEAFKRAYLAYEDPAFLYNIAQCYRQLGDKASAVKFYRSYLRKVPDAPNRDEVTSTIASLDAAIAADNAKAAATAPVATPTPPPRNDSTVAVAPSQTLVTTPPPKRTPVYKKWWLWTIVGVVAAGAAAGVAVAVTSQRTENSFMPVTVTQ